MLLLGCKKKLKEGNRKKRSMNLTCMAVCCLTQFWKLGTVQENITFIPMNCIAYQHCVPLATWNFSKMKASVTRLVVWSKFLYLFKPCIHCALLITILRLQLSEEKKGKEMIFSIHSAAVPAHLLSNRQLLSLL